MNMSSNTHDHNMKFEEKLLLRTQHNYHVPVKKFAPLIIPSYLMYEVRLQERYTAPRL